MMISSIQGILEARGEDWVDVAIGGVSIRAMVPASAMSGLGPIGGPVRLFTHLIVRDENIDLYVVRQAKALTQLFGNGYLPAFGYSHDVLRMNFIPL